MTENFKTKFIEAYNKNKPNNWADNFDYRRFGPIQNLTLKQKAKNIVKTILESLHIRENSMRILILENESKLDWLYGRLQDEESRQLLVDLMAFRALGHRKVKLPLSTPEYWKKLEELEQEQDHQDSIDIGFLNWKVERHDLSSEGYPVNIYARPSGIYTQFILQQYRCPTKDHAIEVASGDTVIDAGGCYGDTALYFAHKAGPQGKVYSFEFMQDNIKIFDRNLSINQNLADTIQIIPNPLWSTSDNRLYVVGHGPSAYITPTPKTNNALQVTTLRIDDLVKQKQSDRIDFIKMDIEGAELEALKGAENTIRRDRPKLAISVYHNLHDFWTIPQWIDGLNLGYRFYLRHFTIHHEETVLFAEVTSQ